MNFFVLYLLLWIWDNQSFNSITKRNHIKTEAEIAFGKREYKKATALYHQITYGSIFAEPAARFNLAQGYLFINKRREATRQFKLLEKVNDADVASLANTQLAWIALEDKDTLEALRLLKVALRQYDDNYVARYNYELLKLTFKGVRELEKPASLPPPVSRENLSSTGQSPEESIKREQFLIQLKNMNMSEEQARAILETMKNNETQYIYQLRRKQYHTEDKVSKTPEW